MPVLADPKEIFKGPFQELRKRRKDEFAKLCESKGGHVKDIEDDVIKFSVTRDVGIAHEEMIETARVCVLPMDTIDDTAKYTLIVVFIAMLVISVGCNIWLGFNTFIAKRTAHNQSKDSMRNTVHGPEQKAKEDV